MKGMLAVFLALLLALPGVALAEEQAQEASIVIEVSDESDAPVAIGNVVLQPGGAYDFSFSHDKDAQELTLGEVLQAVDPVNGPETLRNAQVYSATEGVPLGEGDPFEATQAGGQARIILEVHKKSGSVVIVPTPAPYTPTAVTVCKAQLYAQPDTDTYLRNLPEDTQVEVVAWGIGPEGAWHRVIVDNQAFYVLSEYLDE